MLVNCLTFFLRDYLSAISARLIAIVARYFYNCVRMFVLERRDYDFPKFFVPHVLDLKYDLTGAHSNWSFLQILPTIKRLSIIQLCIDNMRHKMKYFNSLNQYKLI